jgi:hypothetical protein
VRAFTVERINPALEASGGNQGTPRTSHRPERTLA